LTACSVVLKPSRTLAAILGTVHGLALAAAIASLSGMPLVMICIGVVLSAGATVADALLRLPSSALSFDLDEDGTGRWRDRAGREHPVRAANATWVGAGVVVLGLRQSRWKAKWLVLLPDSAAGESLRRLRVWLKWRPV
jgi:hypothetical protein